MIDGIIISAPTVTGVITGGNVEISGDFTVPQARALAAGLGSGRLPVKLYLESYQINKARVVTVSQKMLMLLIICFVLSGAISYFLFSLPKPLVNK
jgi:preprotein translocase subunit SecD